MEALLEGVEIRGVRFIKLLLASPAWLLPDLHRYAAIETVVDLGIARRKRAEREQSRRGGRCRSGAQAMDLACIVTQSVRTRGERTSRLHGGSDPRLRRQ